MSTGPQSCLVLRYEAYSLPGWARLLRPPISQYLRWTMKREMRDVRALILTRSAQPAPAIAARSHNKLWYTDRLVARDCAAAY